MVGVTLRPDIEWPKLRAEFEAGGTFGGIGRRHGISRQAVQQRAKREGWVRNPDAAALAATDTARRLERPRTPQERRLAAGSGTSKRSMSAAQRLLDMLACGATLALAARRLGMSPDAVRDWLRQDAELAALVEKAQADFAAGLVQHIADAAPRDWRAAGHLLERLPATRDEYRAAPDAMASGGMIAVQIVLPDDLAAVLAAPAPAAAPQVIDATADTGPASDRRAGK